MTLYLDTSALVKLYVAEEGSPLVHQAVANTPSVATSAIAYVEARAAFARRRRDGSLPLQEYRRILRDLDADWDHYLRIDVTEPLIREAAELAERHRLRAYDAIHLASAHVVKERLLEPVVFASWDKTLEAAARRHGLQPLPRQSPKP
ncbi:MAG: type II toxin-antitoxin system VapC family toxin [candidate division NC10 bacterium]|nr:type II toxin-antitoxin system VapC family toxin [candidate division NC10 bacterium]